LSNLTTQNLSTLGPMGSGIAVRVGAQKRPNCSLM